MKGGLDVSFLIYVMASAVLLLIRSEGGMVQAIASAPSFSPTPAPAPAPDYVNLTDLLTVAGPFHTFLSYLQSTKVIDTFQNQANDTEEGITIFVPKDSAFSNLKKPSLSNLTDDQLKSLCLSHAMPHYYTLADFNNLTELSPVSTFGGGQYSLNFTDDAGTVSLSTGLTITKVTSSVHSTDPVAVYQVDRVLLPEAIFGTNVSVSDAPAPAPAPADSPLADSPTKSTEDEKPNSSKDTSSSPRNNAGWSRLLLAIPSAIIAVLFI